MTLSPRQPAEEAGEDGKSVWALAPDNYFLTPTGMASPVTVAAMAQYGNSIHFFGEDALILFRYVIQDSTDLST